ncbi:MAG: hypothetical protein Lokiarch_41660 [Candidatus Lokiarchaeum sp. GC14_75]|nr:MAG: hypothetical protein Lokiarch_41660 [Candidatus Lokiarchaeum sp. GC14_75]
MFHWYKDLVGTGTLFVKLSASILARKFQNKRKIPKFKKFGIFWLRGYKAGKISRE